MEADRFSLAAQIRDLCLLHLNPRPRSIAIFGSFAGGVLHETSDIDLLLIGDSIPRKPFQRAQWFLPVRLAFQKEAATQFSAFPSILSPVFLSEEGWREAVGLRLSLSQQAWILWDDGTLSSTLSESAGWIASGLWRREDVVSGGWFWIPKGAGK
ncbi:MAG: hypothetical protein C5B49_03095 [Bdellovibrio sp.]|nr:MAG: hypothetical protein C5B49_03095 [Bdellovibrio sp.]